MNQINGLYAYRNQMYAQNQPKKPGKNDRPEGPMGPNGAPAEPTSISDETVEKFKARVREKVESGEINKTQDTEVQLSDKAKALLEELKQKYDNIDFFVADYSSDEEAQSYLDRGTKEYSVLIDPETLEAMAADEETKEKYTGMIDEATAKLADMKDQLEESGVQVKSLGVSIADDGSMTLFASIEEMSAKREEHLEKMREKKAAEKEKAEKADEEKAEEEDAAKKPDDKPPFMKPGMPERPEGPAGYNKPDFGGKVKETTVSATSVEELLEKIQNVDWSQIEAKEKKPPVGGHFDFQF